jgi:two-component system nitrate/nitrite response regulator NarL
MILQKESDNLAVASVNVLLLDDHGMFREGLARVLEKEPGINVVAQAATCAGALPLLSESGASMVLLDVDLGPERALDFIVEARKRGFAGQILVVTAGVSGPEAVQLVQAGVAGILHKHHSTEALLKTISRVAGGEVCLEQEYLTALFRSVDRTKESTRARLSDRDKKILRYIFQGLTNKEIGSRIEISEGAVKFSLRQLCEKLGVRTRAQLVKVALEQYRDQLDQR